MTQLTLTLGLLCLLSSLPTSAGAAALGVTLEYEELMRLHEVRGADVMDHYDAVGAAGLLDFERLRLSVGYTQNIGAHIRFVDGQESQDRGYRIRYVNASALGKHPIRYLDGDLTLWPALGLRGALNLEYAYTGDGGRAVDEAPHDLSALGGVGLDYALSRRLSLTGALLGSYNLTPGEGEARAFSLGLSLGVALRR